MMVGTHPEDVLNEIASYVALIDNACFGANETRRFQAETITAIGDIAYEMSQKLAVINQEIESRKWIIVHAASDESLDKTQEAFLNLTEMEQRRFIKWAQGHMNSAKAA